RRSRGIRESVARCGPYRVFVQAHARRGHRYGGRANRREAAELHARGAEHADGDVRIDGGHRRTIPEQILDTVRELGRGELAQASDGRRSRGKAQAAGRPPPAPPVVFPAPPAPVPIAPVPVDPLPTVVPDGPSPSRWPIREPISPVQPAAATYAAKA